MVTPRATPAARPPTVQSPTPHQGYSVLHLFNSKNLQRAPTRGPVPNFTGGLGDVGEEDVCKGCPVLEVGGDIADDGVLRL